MTNSYPPSGASDQSPLYTDTARQVEAPSFDEVTPVDDVTANTDTTMPGFPATSGSSSGSQSGSGSDSSGTAGAAKGAAAEVGHSAKEATGQVAGTAKDEAGKVASEAKSQAKDLYHQTRSELTDQASTQQKRVAEGLRSVSDELKGMHGKSESQGVATELVGQAAERLQGVAGWLDDRDPGSLLDEVKQFAARRPGVFIGVAAAAGLLAGRLTKGLVSEAKDHSDPATGAGAAASAAPTAETPAPTTTRAASTTGTVGGSGNGLADDPLLDEFGAGTGTTPGTGAGGLR